MSDKLLNAGDDLHDWGNRERNTLVLNYTAQCPLSCDFCCYGCNPQRKEKMDFSRALNLIQESAPFDDFTSVAFTGGEPLLFPDEIVNLAGAAKRAGKNSTIATAAHWASSKQAAKDLIERLVESGLNRLNVSFDGSHEKYVPRGNIYNVVNAIQDFGIPLYIISTHYSETDFNQEDLSDHAHGIFHFRKLVAKAGMATKAKIDYGDQPSFEQMSCYRRVYHDLVVFYDGKAYPCCSTFNRASRGLVLGNSWTDGFAQLRIRLLGSVMLRAMKGSFSTFIAVLERYDEKCAEDVRALENNAGPCGFCNKIFKNPAMYERVYAAFERAEDELFRHAVEGLRTAGVTEVELTP